MFTYFNARNGNLNNISNNIGDISSITNETYSNIAELLQYYINNKWLPDLNLISLVPKLNGNNSQVLTDSTNPNYFAWEAFDQNDSTFFLCEGTYIGYDFLKNVTVKKIAWKGYNNRVFPGFGASAKLQGSSNGSSWTDVANISGDSSSEVDREFNVPAPKTYRYWRVNNTKNFGLYYLQFYGS